ncbi:unnamed protein product [Prorocentrum cordatum]|uniref:Uncharacterized protein n=1 Tax=Prorocentrum cordatum TaxID=2364126 RepID=A0ABN9UCV0_9DINO|nr:unnamed protein product [Polarella glacialis]
MAALPAAAQRGGSLGYAVGEFDGQVPAAPEEDRRRRRARLEQAGHSAGGFGQDDAGRAAGRQLHLGHGRHPGGHLQTPAHLHYEQLDRQRPRGPELAGPSEAPHLRLRTLRAEASGRESRGCTPTRSSTLAAPAGANGCWSTTGGGLLGPPSPSRASRGKSTTASSSASALAAHRQERCGF